MTPDTSVPSITVSELADRRKSGDEPILLDIRRGQERGFASIGGKHIEMSELPDKLDELEDWKDQEIVVYCRSGQRSANVVRFLRGQGFDKAVNLHGGILAWSREIDPEVPRY